MLIIGYEKVRNMGNTAKLLGKFPQTNPLTAGPPRFHPAIAFPRLALHQGRVCDLVLSALNPVIGWPFCSGSR
jgi:hypothetical protein